MYASCELLIWLRHSRCLDVAVEDPSGSLGAAVADLSEHALKRILSSDNLKACDSEIGQRMLHSSCMAVVDMPPDHLVVLCLTQVECELDVWHMLQQWLDADLTARSRSVASFMSEQPQSLLTCY